MGSGFPPRAGEMSDGQRGHITTLLESSIMDDSKPKADWLVNNAVVSFVAALVLGQSIRSASEPPTILWGFEVPRVPESLIIATISVLCVVSLYLLLASKLDKLKAWTFKAVETFDYVFHLLFFSSFTVGYLDAASELPYDQWWAYVLFFVGYALFLFLGVRFVLSRP